MTPKDHANLLSIFAWIMGGLQLLFVLFFGLYVLLMGGIAVAMAFDPTVKDPGGPIFMGVIAAIFCVFLVLGLTGTVTNFLLGKRLRAKTPPSRNFVIAASVINFAGFFFGGVFAAALGGYAMWFAMSDAGKAFFAGQGDPYSPGYLREGQYSTFDPMYDPNYPRDPNRVNWR